MSTATIGVPRPREHSHTSRRPTAPVRRSEALGSVRLTRRGRLFLLLCGLGLAFGAFTVVSDPAESTHVAHRVAAEQVVVEPGQTLWDIAQQVAPGEDTRAVIDEIVRLNSLTSAGDIVAGQPLYVPEY